MKERISKPLSRLLTKKVLVKSGKRMKPVEIPPSQTLVYGILAATVTLVLLVILEIAHMAFMGTFNTEIFATITLIVGALLGTFFGQKA
jgi:hypothetical protein